MKIVIRPEPPAIDPEFPRMNGLQRAAESFRYVLLRWEHWSSPTGDMREWLRHNTRVGARLLIPAIFVMPFIGFILWQVTGWLSMVTSIAAKLTFLPVLLLVASISLRVACAIIGAFTR